MRISSFKLREEKFLPLLIFISLTGGLIRAFFAFLLPLESDEVYQLFASRAPILPMLKATLDVHAPLWSLALHFFEAFSQNYVLIRFTAVITGMLSIILIGFLAKAIFNYKTGLLAALVFALSPTQIYYSANLRMYSVSIFIALLIFLSFLSYLNSNSKSSKLFLLLSLTLGNYTYYLFPLLPFSFLLYIFLNRKKINDKLKSYLWVFAISLIASFPLFASFLNVEPLPRAVLPEFSLQKIFLIPIHFSFAQNLAFMLSPKLLKINLPKLMLLSLSLLNIILFLSIFLKKIKNNEQFLLFFLAIPITFTIIFSVLVLPVLGLRSVLIFSIPFYILIARAIETNWKLKLLFLSLSLAAIFSTSIFFARKPQDPVDSFLLTNVKKNETILHSEVTTFLYFSYKYPQFKHLAAINSLYTPVLTQSVLGYRPVDVPSLDRKSFWLIEILPSPLHKNLIADFKANISRTHKKVLEKNFGDVELYNFETL